MELNITELLSRLLFTLPHIAIWITAIVLCTQYRKHSERETTFFIMGFGIMIAYILITNIAQSWLLANYEELGLPISTMFSILHAGGVVIELIAWALILTGIYQLLQQKHASKENNESK